MKSSASLGESDIAFENDEKHEIDDFLVPPAEDPPKGYILPDEVSEYDEEIIWPTTETFGYILPDEVSEYDEEIIRPTADTTDSVLSVLKKAPRRVSEI